MLVSKADQLLLIILVKELLVVAPLQVVIVKELTVKDLQLLLSLHHPSCAALPGVPLLLLSDLLASCAVLGAQCVHDLGWLQMWMNCESVAACTGHPL